MHIAIFTDSFEPQIGGIVSSTVSFIRSMAPEHRISVFAIYDPKHPPGFAHPNVRLVLFKAKPLPTYKEGLACLPPLREVRKELEADRPAIAICHTLGVVGLTGHHIARRLGIPTIGVAHTYIDKYLHYFLVPKIKLTEKITQKIMARHYSDYTHVVAPTQAMAASLRSWGLKAPVHVISNPLDLERFLPVERERMQRRYRLGEQVVLYFGRIAPEKRVEVVIDAFKHVHRRFPKAQLLIVGDGPSLRAIKRRAKKSGILPACVFTGFQRGQALTDLIHCGAVFCTASTSETQGIVVLEAQACGVPVVVVDSLGVSENVTDGKSGLLVKPERPRALAQSLIRVLADRTLRARLARGAKSAARQAATDKVMAHWRALLRKAAR